MFIVAVQFTFAAENAETFKDAILPNAAASAQTEPGCHQFDVCFSADKTKCFLYEVYDDEAAFFAHKETAHFKKFAAATADIILERRFDSYERLTNPFAQS